MLLSKIRRAVHNENISTLKVLELLGDLESSGEHFKSGYNSLYDYLTNGLKYSEGAATRRIQAARVLKRFPDTRELFVQRKVSLCTLSLVARKAIKEGAEELIKKIAGKSKRAVEEMLALEDGRSTLRETVELVAVKVPAPVAKKTSPKSAVISTSTSLCPDKTETAPEPVVEERMKLAFSVKKDDYELVQKARTLLSNKYPQRATLEELFLLGLKRVVAHEEHRHQKMGSKKTTELKEGRRYIPAGLRKQVMKRDGGCCSFRHDDGSRCGSKWQLEIDHIRPFSKGGRSRFDNLRVCCRKHNQYLGKLFG